MRRPPGRPYPKAMSAPGWRGASTSRPSTRCRSSRTPPWSRRTAPPMCERRSGRGLGADPGRLDRARRPRPSRPASPTSNVIVHRMMLGGGFGRRGPSRTIVREAVLIAKGVERRSSWCGRAKRISQHDFYRPYGMARLVAGLDAGHAEAWKIRLAGPSFVAAIVCGFGIERRRPELPQRLDRGDAVRRAQLPGRLRHASNARAGRRLACDQLFRRTRFTKKASSTRWRMPRNRSLPVSAAPAAQQTQRPRGARCRRGARRVARRLRPESSAALRSTKRAAATARRWSRFRSNAATCV